MTTNLKKILIAPSILAADFGDLKNEIRSIESADLIHVDVMDGSFVPPITFGDNVVKLAKSCSKLFIETHLMIENPENHLKSFKDAGSNRIIIHQEATKHLHRALGEIKSLGISNGVALNPATPIDTVKNVLDICDLVLIMTVNPGWGGQKFIESSLEKIRNLKSMIASAGTATLIEVDGGLNKVTAKNCAQAGVDIIVAGTSIFGSKNRNDAIRELRG